jgi:hypothetical protein
MDAMQHSIFHYEAKGKKILFGFTSGVGKFDSRSA